MKRSSLYIPVPGLTAPIGRIDQSMDQGEGMYSQFDHQALPQQDIAPASEELSTSPQQPPAFFEQFIPKNWKVGDPITPELIGTILQMLKSGQPLPPAFASLASLLPQPPPSQPVEAQLRSSGVFPYYAQQPQQPLTLSQSSAPVDTWDLNPDEDSSSESGEDDESDQD